MNSGRLASAASTQDGSGNTSSITQTNSLVAGAESNNTADAFQLGDDNLSTIEQDGAFNDADLDQIGNNNMSLISQMGEGNTATVLQGSDGNMSTVTQNGIGNSAMVTQ